MNYYRISSDLKSVERAPSFLLIDGVLVECPNAAQYASCGCFQLSPAQPEEREGYAPIFDHYEVVDGLICAFWRYDPLPPKVTRYSKLKIYGAISSIGKWSEVEAWLKAKEIDGVNGWMAFQLAQEVADDHPLFAPLAAEAKELLGLSDEQFAALLAQCVLED